MIVSALREEGFEVAFNVDGYRDEGDALEEGEDESKVEIKIKSKQDGRWMLLEDFLATEADRSRHEFVRTNVMSLTRIFNQRVKAFLRVIITVVGSLVPPPPPGHSRSHYSQLRFIYTLILSLTILNLARAYCT